ncbi:unnamed protein product [Orchesella dallaii]|uniref:Uncharacterized protein n=1 Tax=Orchesella dallaii TaxID=48710 RepID=A0ABP1QKN8_9HEXA
MQTQTPVPVFRNNSFGVMDWRVVVAISLAFWVPIIFPAGHMFVFNKVWPKDAVNAKQCTCSCWDTVYKGPYEFGTDSKFKHVYFNVDRTTLKMWIITVIGVLFLYETFKYVFLIVLYKRLRWTMGVLFLISLHSHYYSWWAYWNFWNDNFYSMWYHQILFSLTELISSALVLSYMDTKRQVEPVPMLIISTIAIFHAFWSGLDQFVLNILKRRGRLHQVLRDLALMTTDLFHVILSFHELGELATYKGVSLLAILMQRSSLYAVLLVFTCMYLLVRLLP